MRRNSKAARDGRENKRAHAYWVSCKGHGEFTHICRRVIRARAKQALREGQEPLPKDPKHWEYYD
ncbi:MAG: hypothetical protein LBN12_03415 [Clostridiales Family XIII bacterium]|jgi:hypothetical protein|nr:hypothetical protein [Clostridiales Family XIII bacterium]